MDVRKNLDERNYLEKYYTIENPSIIDKTVFHISHYNANREIQNNDDWDKWNQITNHLYLGKIPTQNMTNELLDKNLIPNLKLVVSCVKPFELNRDIGNRIITKPADWKKNGVNHHQIMITDFTADVEVADLYATVKKMREHIERGEDVYVHCKAGKSRSAMVIATYLAIYEMKPGGICQHCKTAEDIYLYIKKNLREQVSLHEPQFAKIEAALAYHKIHSQEKADFDYAKAKTIGKAVSMDDIHAYLTSFAGKQAVAQLSATKSFLIYADEKKQIFKSSESRQHQIQLFLDQIYRARDQAAWLDTLFNETGPINKLMMARPFKGMFGITGEPKARQLIVNMMKNDVTELLATVFACDKKDIQKLLQENVMALKAEQRGSLSK